MPGPFPGMDPYLEDPFRWQGVHNTLITYIAAELNATLPPDYVADTGVRCVAEWQSGSILPDVFVQEEQGIATTGRSGSVSVLEGTRAIDAPLRLQAMEVEERQAYVNIINTRNEQIVSVIELLSPTNKNKNNSGWEAYRHKQRELLASHTSLIEIDLLRAGIYTVAVPISLIPPQRKWNYLTCLHRGGQGSVFEVWPHTVRECLPCIAVPLGANMPDLPLDLQQPFNRCYDEGRYNRKIQYAHEPIPPLSAEDAVWADALLREKGLRS